MGDSWELIQNKGRNGSKSYIWIFLIFTSYSPHVYEFHQQNQWSEIVFCLKNDPVLACTIQLRFSNLRLSSLFAENELLNIYWDHKRSQEKIQLIDTGNWDFKYKALLLSCTLLNNLYIVSGDINKYQGEDKNNAYWARYFVILPWSKGVGWVFAWFWKGVSWESSSCVPESVKCCMSGTPAEIILALNSLGSIVKELAFIVSIKVAAEYCRNMETQPYQCI